jgi:hypothetical protein
VIQAGAVSFLWWNSFNFIVATYFSYLALPLSLNVSCVLLKFFTSYAFISSLAYAFPRPRTVEGPASMNTRPSSSLYFYLPSSQQFGRTQYYPSACLMHKEGRLRTLRISRVVCAHVPHGRGLTGGSSSSVGKDRRHADRTISNCRAFMRRHSQR